MALIVTRQWPDGTVSRGEPISDLSPIMEVFKQFGGPELITSVTVTAADGRTAIYTLGEPSNGTPRRSRAPSYAEWRAMAGRLGECLKFYLEHNNDEWRQACEVALVAHDKMEERE